MLAELTLISAPKFYNKISTSFLDPQTELASARKLGLSQDRMSYLEDWATSRTPFAFNKPKKVEFFFPISVKKKNRVVSSSF